jgi:TatD DNase family protein
MSNPEASTNSEVLDWTDIHMHFNMLESAPAEVIARAKKNGVRRFITIGTNPKDHPLVLELAEKYQPDVFCTLGIHPHDAESLTPDAMNFMDKNVSNPRVVAVGEIGLDYYYNNSPREVQINAYRAQMRLAAKYNLPVEIHTRDAEEDTIKMMEEFSGQVKGVLHCFTGTQNLANHALKHGYNISISGVVTFKKADDLREVVKNVPLDRIHVETDAPFLTPVPFRGKTNEPSYMVHTAECVAKIKNVTLADLARQTELNAKNLFSKLV